MFSTFLSVFLSQRQVAVTAVTACLSLLCSGQIMTRMTAALTVIPVSFLRALLLPWCCSVPPPFTPPQWEMFICHIINVTLAVKKKSAPLFSSPIVRRAPRLPLLGGTSEGRDPG